MDRMFVFFLHSRWIQETSSAYGCRPALYFAALSAVVILSLVLWGCGVVFLVFSLSVRSLGFGS